MNALELFTRIRHELDEISGYIAECEKARRSCDQKSPGMPGYLEDYNYATCHELLNLDTIRPDFEIDSLIVEEFEHTLDLYLDTHAPGKKDLKRYITSLSLYLTFIAKRPLHPPGVPFSKEIRIVKKGEFFYCSKKRRFLADPSSCCRFCVCRPM